MKISGVDVKELKKEFGTPLYIYDAAMLKNNMRLYKNNFKSNQFETEVLFASKAFNVKEMVRIVDQEGLSLDCVSIGEFYTALNVGYNPQKIYFHGNNKSPDELRFIIMNNVGTIVVDNLMELVALDMITKELKNQLTLSLD